MTKINNWRSSWRALKDAVRFCQDRWVQVSWLIIGQVILGVIVVALISSSGEGSIYASAYGVGGNVVIQTIAALLSFLYSVIYTLTLTELVRQPKVRALSSILGNDVFPRLISAIGLSVIWGVAIFVASLLFIIPGIILYVYWLFVVFSFVIERSTVKKAFQKSFWLVKGWWWPVLGRLLALVALGTVITAFSVIPGTGLFVSIVLSLLLSPVMIVFLAQTYQELVQAKSVSRRSSMGVFAKIILFVSAIVIFFLFSFVSIARDFVVNIMFLS